MLNGQPLQDAAPALQCTVASDLSDTDPDAARIQRELLRRAGPARRMDLAFSLSRTVISLSREGLARRFPSEDSREIVVAELRPEHGTPLVAALSSAYYISEERVRDAIVRHGSFNAIHLDSMVKVDVFISKGRPLDQQAMDRARSYPNRDAGGRSLPLASAEDTVLAKLEWYRRGDEVSERQWGDILGVLRSSGRSLDLAYLETGAHELSVADLLARALKDSQAAPR